jgi:hypothetical protein
MLSNTKLGFIAPEESDFTIQGEFSGDGLIEHARSMARLSGLSHLLTDDLSQADIILVLEPSVIRNYQTYAKSLISHPVIKEYPERCYTYNGVDRPWAILPGMYTSLLRMRADVWFHCGGPHMYFPNKHVQESSSTEGVSSVAKKRLACFRGSQTSPLRSKLFKAAQAGHFSNAICIGKSHGAFFANGDEGQKLYCEEIRDHAFSLSPAGYGPSTFRLYESMALGRAPVVIADSWMPPHRIAWDQCALIVPESDLMNIEKILENEFDRHVALGSAAKRVYDEHFSPQSVMKFILQSIVSIHENNPYPKDREWRNSWIRRAAKDAPAPPLANRIVRALRKARGSKF